MTPAPRNIAGVSRNTIPSLMIQTPCRICFVTCLIIYTVEAGIDVYILSTTIGLSVELRTYCQIGFLFQCCKYTGCSVCIIHRLHRGQGTKIPSIMHPNASSALNETCHIKLATNYIPTSPVSQSSQDEFGDVSTERVSGMDSKEDIYSTGT